MNRNEMLPRARDRREPWDIVVVGGGATGAGIAVDAAARGYEVLLLERGDFGVGTSSRSTKLVHGGVRYLQQGHLGLVFEALHERGRLRANAPHLVHDLGFVLPCYRFGQRLFYGLGLKTYDYLAGRYGFGHTKMLSRSETQQRLPTIALEKLRGGVLYHDGQFDDARLLIHLMMTAAGLGATVLNYAEVHGLTHSATGAVDGVLARDLESGAEFRASARIVINAAGPFCDDIRKMANPEAPAMVAASRGSHVVLDRSFLPGDCALLVPSTPDGRVLFVIPWHGHTLVGTTDIALSSAPVEPRCTEEEMNFILETAGRYLTKPPRPEDVLSTFAGIRPLVKAGGGKTSKLSRDFSIRDDQPGLLTVAGGKWTTYRAMAEACVNRAAAIAKLPAMPCPTKELSLHGYHLNAAEFGDLAGYGSDAPEIRRLVENDPVLGERLHPDLPYIAAEVVWAAREEMARSVEDVLARRTRALVLNAKAATAMAPRVAELLARELGRDANWAREQVAKATHAGANYSGKSLV